MSEMSKNIHVRTQQDLNLVDACLRNLYHTQPGQPCQYLLTSTYQKWLIQVRTELQLCAKAKDKNVHMKTIDTYLPNYHIIFLDNNVQIEFIRPYLYKNKRKRESE